MARQYLSICGHSAAGKKALVHGLLLGEPPGLRERFGVTGTVQAYGIWTEIQPLERIFDTAEESVIHFWQDASHAWIECLRRTFPRARHRVVLLWRPWVEHSAGLLARQDGYGPVPAEVEAHWHRHLVPRFRGIEATGIEFELVDASTPAYPRLADWPRWER